MKLMGELKRWSAVHEPLKDLVKEFFQNFEYEYSHPSNKADFSHIFLIEYKFRILECGVGRLDSQKGEGNSGPVA